MSANVLNSDDAN